jgi:hypothetical protein
MHAKVNNAINGKKKNYHIHSILLQKIEHLAAQSKKRDDVDSSDSDFSSDVDSHDHSHSHSHEDHDYDLKGH